MRAELSSNDCFRFAIASSCQEVWGGCEELWAGVATFLTEAGHQVKIYKTNVDAKHERIAQLESVGCPVVELNDNLPVFSRVINRFLPSDRQYSKSEATQLLWQKTLDSFRPHLIV